ncbi:helix-turn-helix domain-containing protein [Pantoea stewartii]|uniref:helix-turn-helix domain-containing protein n=1 Tax=Pantoea stewartii TaxID=66269 RepID=UPI001561FC3C|nr:helix-turn-helix transcriptional regulator [Pantoea stewartii]NRH22917.1 hypothetical protein [Pantoea stewartii]
MKYKFSLSLAVRKLCRRQGLYLSQFAERASISKSTLQDAMKSNSPKLETCERSAAGFSIPLAEFIAEGYPISKREKMIRLPAVCRPNIDDASEVNAIRAYAVAEGETKYMSKALSAISAAGVKVEVMHEHNVFTDG